MVLDLIGTWLGLGIGGFGTKGLGSGLDNILELHNCESYDDVYEIYWIIASECYRGQFIQRSHELTRLSTFISTERYME